MGHPKFPEILLFRQKVRVEAQSFRSCHIGPDFILHALWPRENNMFLDWRQKLERANARQRQVNRENQQRERRWRDFLKTAETIEQEEERLRNEKKHAQFLKEQERKTQNIEAETNESVVRDPPNFFPLRCFLPTYSWFNF